MSPTCNSVTCPWCRSGAALQLSPAVSEGPPVFYSQRGHHQLHEVSDPGQRGGVPAEVGRLSPHLTPPQCQQTRVIR